MLSILRRLFFFGLILYLIILFIADISVPVLALSVIGYVVTVLITFLHSKLTHEDTPLIELIIREDIRDPIIKHSHNHYHKGARIWNIWHFRNHKYRTTKEKIKAWIMRIIVAFIIILILIAVIGVIG